MTLGELRCETLENRHSVNHTKPAKDRAFLHDVTLAQGNPYEETSTDHTPGHPNPPWCPNFPKKRRCIGSTPGKNKDEDEPPIGEKGEVDLQDKSKDFDHFSEPVFDVPPGFSNPVPKTSLGAQQVSTGTLATLDQLDTSSLQLLLDWIVKLCAC